MTLLESAMPFKVRHHLKLFLALSRTPHGVIDMAAPALAALLSLGHFPAISILVVGLITVFAGYSAIYALNDLVDLRSDRHKAGAGIFIGHQKGMDLDSTLLRHPIAKGDLSLSAGLAWTIFWAAITLIGAWWLNPVCFFIFLAGCLLESIYCLLWRVTPLRTLVNGVVKTLGPVAAVFAVTPEPSWIFLIVLFGWLFFWEIGGQNIPNDWIDIEKDRIFKAQTIPLRLGTHRAGIISLLTLVATLFLNFLLFWVSPIQFNTLLLFTVLAINSWLLLWPGIQLAEKQEHHKATILFNRASYYPLANLVLVFIACLK